MGYTHYFESKTKFTTANWNKFKKEAKLVFLKYKNILANGLGEKNTSPIVTAKFISFNGIQDDSHETCFISKTNVGFNFCKTALKPYDVVVVEILKLAQKYNKSIALTSDGGSNVFN